MIVAGFSKSLTTFFRLSFVCSVIVPPLEYHTTKRRQSAPKIRVPIDMINNEVGNNNTAESIDITVDIRRNIVEFIARISDDERERERVRIRHTISSKKENKKRKDNTQKIILERKIFLFTYFGWLYEKHLPFFLFFWCTKIIYTNFFYLIFFCVAVVPHEFLSVGFSFFFFL